MSSRLTRRAFQAAAWARRYHQLSTGGPQRPGAFRTRRFHNAVAVRHASFARFLPKLVLKFLRVPALFGGLMIGGATWVQYQAIQVSNSAQEMYSNMKNTVASTATGLWGSALDIAEQTKRGWENTKEQVEVPDWMQKILRIHEEIGTGKGGGDGQGGPDPEPPKQSRTGGAAAVAGASAAAYGYDSSDEKDDRTPDEIAKDDQMMILTKKMIEIRNILQQVGQSSSITLPSIVVIGSQSSGKSSVLEAIVGHEFLPKGSNMVTRRPIELTLVNTPGAKTEYGEFPDLGRKMTDFSAIQRTLTELNLSVPDGVCVSDDPIHLRIYSPNVPDLSLIDLPGYIQVVGQNQPLELKQKIADLCEKYIQPPNVILAISAADVDLANSTALQASRRVDPRGERTIGVITKMDLVDPTRGASILLDKQYPLRLGYVGVVSKAPSQAGLFKRDTGNLMSIVTRNERAFFSSHPEEFGPHSGVTVGTTILRRKLMQTLERTMSGSLQSTMDAIQRELTEANYQFKARYNGRPLTAKTYIARSLDEFKHSYRKLEDSFGPEQLFDIVKDALDQQVLDQLALRYWNKPISDLSPSRFDDEEDVANLPKADPENEYWKHQLDGSVAALTTMGVGRAATGVVKHAIESKIKTLVDQSSFAHHPTARQKILEAASDILDDLYARTSDQVETSIRPFKPSRNLDKPRDIKVEGPEWDHGRDHAADLLNAELEQCQNAMKNLEKISGGRWKLQEVMKFVDKARKGAVVVEGESRVGAGGYSAQLLAQGREAVFLRDRADIIRMRIMAVKSRQCKTPKNKYYCPEIFLDTVATKLATPAALHLQSDLLEEFYYHFPRELDQRLDHGLSPEDVDRLAKEDRKVREQLDFMRRKELLETVLDKMESLRRLEGLEKGRRRPAAPERGSRWGF